MKKVIKIHSVILNDKVIIKASSTITPNDNKMTRLHTKKRPKSAIGIITV